MRKFTFITEYKANIYINQYKAECLTDATLLWANNLNSQGFKLNDRQQQLIVEQILDGEFFAPIKEVDNVWHDIYLYGKKFINLNVVETV